ncbi:hypothetical protein H7Y63_00180 [Polaromonas sp.]|nr:hypothetical protein [Candidatus Saccharibacteria bacterium]
MAHEADAPAQLQLPLLVVSPVDVGRLIRDVEALDNQLMQFDLKGQTHEAKMPKTSLLLEAIIDSNKLDLLVPAQRKQLLDFLAQIRAHAPVLHISFSADPAASFIEKLMTWLRQEISPQVLLTVGLQPNIGAGCLVRSTNKFYDFSLRQNFTKNRELLMASFKEVVKT